jgi:hypothetical protein
MKKRGGMRNYKGQMQVAFGTIFSIILIIIFIAFAIYAITKFLDMSKFAKVEAFKDSFQKDIDKMWKSTQGSQVVEYYLPNKIELVCFVDNDLENIYFVPDDFKGGVLENIDFAKTLSGSKTTPKTFCINSVNGKISMTIKKAYNEELVTITK